MRDAASLRRGVRTGASGWFLHLTVAVAAALTVAFVALRADRVTGTLPDTAPPPAAIDADGPTLDETYLWRPVAIGGGGFMVGITSDRSGATMVARTDVHGAYLWREDLDRWMQLAIAPAMPPEFRHPASMEGGVTGLAVAPNDPDRIYMAAQDMVFASSDRGRSWRAAQSGPFPMTYGGGRDYIKHDPVMAVSPSDPDLVFFGTGSKGLLRSTDGGASWTAVSGFPPPREADQPAMVWFVPGEGRQVWALVPEKGMQVSNDGGASFRPLTPGRGPGTLRSGAFAPDGSFFGADEQSRTVWRYRDGKWTDLAADGAIPREGFVTLDINPSNGEIFAFVYNGQPYRSSDGGDSWRGLRKSVSVGEGDPPWLRVADVGFFATSQVHFDRAVPDRLWIAAGTGMFYADVPPGTREVAWTSRARGIEELVTNDVVQSPGRAPMFAAWDFGIHVKSDLDAFSTVFGPKQRMIIAAQQLAISPSDPDFVATNASDTRDCCAEDGDSVLAGYSTDAGRTWSRFATLPHPPGTEKDDPWRMAWGMIAVSSADTDNLVWAPSLNRAPFFTRDRGKSWSRVRFPGETLPLTGSHPAKHLQRKVLTADPVRGGTFYLVHSGNPDNRQLEGLWRSQDGGETWSRLFQGEIAPRSHMAAKLRAMPGREGDLFFTSALEGPHESRLRRSRNGGRDWEVIEAVDRVDDVAFGKPAAGTDVPAIYLSGRVAQEYGIWRSTDDASTWQKIAEYPLGRLDRVVVLAADPLVFGRIYIGWQGSGWLYGEPARCRPEKAQPFQIEECVAVGS